MEGAVACRHGRAAGCFLGLGTWDLGLGGYTEHKRAAMEYDAVRSSFLRLSFVVLGCVGTFDPQAPPPWLSAPALSGISQFYATTV